MYEGGVRRGVVRTGYVCEPAGGRIGELLVGQGLHLSLLCRNVAADLAECPCVSFTHDCVIILAVFRLAFMIAFMNADHGGCGNSFIGSGYVAMPLSCEQTSQVISQVF